MILHKCFHVLLDPLVPLSDVDVQRVVAAGLAVGPFTPLLKGREEADARFRYDMVNWMHKETPVRQPLMQSLGLVTVPNPALQMSLDPTQTHLVNI